MAKTQDTPIISNIHHLILGSATRGKLPQGG
jgi:hypothetical protein